MGLSCRRGGEGIRDGVVFWMDGIMHELGGELRFVRSYELYESALSYRVVLNLPRRRKFANSLRVIGLGVIMGGCKRPENMSFYVITWLCSKSAFLVCSPDSESSREAMIHCDVY